MNAQIIRKKKRVLVVHPYVMPTGGANSVAAWALEALRDEFDVSLATLAPLDHAAVNRSFGTSLKENDFEIILAPAGYRRLLRIVKNPGALLDCQLTVRHAQNLDRNAPFDVLLSTHNEVDFGRRGVQYVNFPGAYIPRSGDPQRFSHRVPGLHRGFRAFCYAVGRATRDGPRRNLFIADSHNIAREIRKVYDAESIILYPPVAGGFPQIPWEQRRAGFVAVGRITASKRWHLAVEIVDGLRARGRDLTLTVIGHREDETYDDHLLRLAATRPWFRMAHNLNRDELMRDIASHRYGLHTMLDEHFGIAPAEILAAGCLPFVHNSGGPVEIVGDSRLTFDAVADAVTKIDAVLRDVNLEQGLREHAARQKRHFTSDAFCSGLRDVIRNFS